MPDYNQDSLVTVSTLEGDKTQIKVKIISKSVLVKGLIEDSGIEEEVPLPNIKKSVLNKIIEFCEHIDANPPPEIEKPLRSNSLSDVVSPWYATFIDLS